MPFSNSVLSASFNATPGGGMRFTFAGSSESPAKTHAAKKTAAKIQKLFMIAALLFENLIIIYRRRAGKVREKKWSTGLHPGVARADMCSPFGTNGGRRDPDQPVCDALL